MRQLNQLLDLSGQTILVTGTTGTIGRATAQRLAAAGARVICHYGTQVDLAEGLAEELGNGAQAVGGDLSSESGVTDFIQMLDAAEITPDGLVNNAADQSVGDLSALTAAQWRQMMQTNLDSVFRLCQWLYRHAATAPDGARIVNISSIEGSDPAPGHGHYATSKAGLDVLTRSMAIEFGPKVRVNSVAPGLIRREGIEEQWPEGVARWQSRAPLQRLGEGADVADAVLFLLCDASRWITGTNLIVDGGMSAQARW